MTRFERFSFAINEIYKYWHKIASEVMEEYGLKGSSAVYFATMSRFSEGITASKLGELCSRNKADVSRVILQMEKKGFIRRENTAKKSYRAKLFLTEEGRNVAMHINRRAKTASDIGSCGMTEEERENFYKYLELIANNLKKLSIDGMVKTPDIIE